jgi:hypothetical protein
MSERILRRAIIDLAALGQSDRAAILRLLEPDMRQRVMALLLEYSGGSHGMPQPALRELDFGRLSAWFALRVRTGEGMTDRSAALLRQCAADMLPAAPDSGPYGRPRLLERFGAHRAGRMA